MRAGSSGSLQFSGPLEKCSCWWGPSDSRQFFLNATQGPSHGRQQIWICRRLRESTREHSPLAPRDILPNPCPPVNPTPDTCPPLLALDEASALVPKHSGNAAENRTRQNPWWHLASRARHQRPPPQGRGDCEADCIEHVPQRAPSESRLHKNPGNDAPSCRAEQRNSPNTRPGTELDMDAAVQLDVRLELESFEAPSVCLEEGFDPPVALDCADILCRNRDRGAVVGRPKQRTRYSGSHKKATRSSILLSCASARHRLLRQHPSLYAVRKPGDLFTGWPTEFLTEIVPKKRH